MRADGLGSQGCRLEMGGAMLRCSHCGTADGARKASEYELARCMPPATLDNQNGVLSCSGVRSAPGIPDGAYKHSCQGCSTRDGTLTCSHCSAANGRQLLSSIELGGCGAPNVIDNQDGTLRCRSA